MNHELHIDHLAHLFVTEALRIDRLGTDYINRLAFLVADYGFEISAATLRAVTATDNGQPAEMDILPAWLRDVVLRARALATMYGG